MTLVSFFEVEARGCVVGDLGNITRTVQEEEETENVTLQRMKMNTKGMKMEHDYDDISDNYDYEDEGGSSWDMNLCVCNFHKCNGHPEEELLG